MLDQLITASNIGLMLDEAALAQVCHVNRNVASGLLCDHHQSVRVDQPVFIELELITQCTVEHNTSGSNFIRYIVW